jgi:hypothetical protein
MSKHDRLAHIIEVYLAGDLELATAAAELLHVYVEQGWRFSLIEAECEPDYQEPMRALARRVDDEVLARRKSRDPGVFVDPPIVIR